MIEAETAAPSAFRQWFSVVRRVFAWIALAGACSSFIATILIDWRYPYAYYVPSPPAAPRWMFSWRNWSLLVGLMASLFSLPKWQSLVALPIVILLLVFVVITAD